MSHIEVTADAWGRGSAAIVRKLPPQDARTNAGLLLTTGADAWGRPRCACCGQCGCSGPCRKFRASMGQDTPTGTPPAAPGAAAPSLPATHGFTSTGELLAYRKMWTPYVQAVAGTGGLLEQIGDSWAALARGEAPKLAPDPGLGVMQQADRAAQQSVMNTLADGSYRRAEYLRTAWNAHADTPDWEIAWYAGNILQDHQKVIRIIGTTDIPDIKKSFPGATLPTAPDPSVQTEVVARLEALGIVSHGALQILGIGASGALDQAVAVEKTAVDAAKAAGNLGLKAGEKIITLADALPYLIGGLLVTVVVVAWRFTTPEGSSVAVKALETYGSRHARFASPKRAAA